MLGVCGMLHVYLSMHVYISVLLITRKYLPHTTKWVEPGVMQTEEDVYLQAYIQDADFASTKIAW